MRLLAHTLPRSPQRRAPAAVARALAPHWGGLLALAVFLIVGLAVLDDYGVTFDEGNQRTIAARNADYIRGWNDSFASEPLWVRLYGVAFEAPLFLADRVFGLDDSRGVHLFRHLVTHLFFLSGGFFAYLLARRLFNNRALALSAMLIFLLHPRLYAHSFFNTKDIPFLVMFVIALFLAHRAFTRDRIGAFVLLGVGVGVLVNLRVMGAVLLAGIPAMRALDFVFAQSQAERKRVLITTGAFALATALSAFALLPYLWGDPFGRAVEWWTASSNHPYTPYELFRGTVYRSTDLPADYLPTWIAITSPPFALLLGLAGAAVVTVNGIRNPRRTLVDGRLRFGLLAAACFVLPLLAVMLLDSNVYDGWRQAYFLWAPLSLLAAFGLERAASAFGRTRWRAMVYGAAGAGVAATVVSMALIHPNQQAAFNFFADRTTPERLVTRYEAEYWGHSLLQAWEYVISARPLGEAAASVANYQFPPRLLVENALVLPRAARERVVEPSGLDAFVVRPGPGERPDLAERRARIYNNTILTIERKDDLEGAYAYAAALGRDPFLDSSYDVYRAGDALLFVKEPCAPSYITEVSFRLRFTPADADDLPRRWKEAGYVNANVPAAAYGALFDGKCVARVPLPDYRLAGLDVRWRPELMDDDEARETARRATEDGQLLTRSVYDLYLADGDLVYVQGPCDANGTERRFFLHVVPERVGDLSEDRRQYGFANLDFDFILNGALLADQCIASVPLPDYPIASIRTGQFISGEGVIWRAEFALPQAPEDGRVTGARLGNS